MLGNPGELVCVFCHEQIGTQRAFHIIRSNGGPMKTIDSRYQGASAHAACANVEALSGRVYNHEDTRAMLIFNRLIAKE